MNSVDTKIKNNTFYNMLKTISTVVFPLIVFPYSSRVLQPESLGKINFATSISNYVSLTASLGVATYAIRICAQQYKKDKLDKLASQIFTINLISTVVSYLALAIVILLNKKLMSESLLIFVFCLPVVFQTLGADWINTALGDLKYIAVRTVLFQIMSIVLIFIFIKKPSDYYGFALISAGASIGANICNTVYRKKYCRIRIVKNIEAKKHLKPIMVLFALTLSQTIFLNVDITMIGFFLGDQDVGMYSVAVKIYNLASTLISAITMVVIPKLASALNNNDYYQVRITQCYAIGYIFTLGIPIVTGIIILAPGIVEIIAGDSYLPASTTLRILAIALIFVMLGGAFLGNIVLLPAGKEIFFMEASIISTIVNFILNFLFISRFGIEAAAIDTVISEIIVFIFLIIKGRKYIFIENINKEISKNVVGSVLFIPIYLMTSQCIINTIVCSVTTIILCTITYFISQIMLKNRFLLDVLNI